jgi:hypothetical protein
MRDIRFPRRQQRRVTIFWAVTPCSPRIYGLTSQTEVFFTVVVDWGTTLQAGRSRVRVPMRRTDFSVDARDSVVGWDTMLQAGRSRVRVPMRSVDFSIGLILPAICPWGRLSLLTKMSTRNLPEGKGRPARTADNLWAYCLENVAASTSHNTMDCYRDSFTFFKGAEIEWQEDSNIFIQKTQNVTSLPNTIKMIKSMSK